MEEKFKKELKDFFLLFSARNSLSEVEMEKIERVIHSLAPKKTEDVEDICEYIVREKIWNQPEEDIVELLKKRKIL